MSNRDEYIHKMQAKLANASQKINELQNFGEGACGDLKTGIELAWASMGETVESARSRFK